MSQRTAIMFVTPKDSRQRYTKQCLFDSLLHHLEEKPVSAITVSEVCEDAGVSRKTFYKYYSDQFALLLAMQDDLFIGFEEELRKLPPNIFAIVPALIRFVGKHRVLLRAVYENRGEGNFIDRVISYLFDAYKKEWELQNPQLSKKEVEFLFFYVVNGIVGIIGHWLFEEPSMSADEVIERAAYLMKLTTPQGP